MKLLLSLLGLSLFADPGWAQAVVNVPPASAKVRLTIARSGPSLVSDQRTASLPAGEALVRISGMPRQLLPDSLLPVVQGPGKVEVLEQRFRYDLNGTAAVLRSYVGQRITLLPREGTAVTGTLLSAADPVLLETANGLLVNPEGTFSVPRLEEGLAVTPTLEWRLRVPEAGSYTLEARYMTAGLNWTANYQGSLNARGDRFGLINWVHVTNATGADFRNAQVALYAGPLDQVQPNFVLPRPVDFPRDLPRQLTYLSVPEMPVTQELVYFPAETAKNLAAPHSGEPMLTLRLRNSAEAGLGVLLPPGPLTVLGVATDETLRLFSRREVPLIVPNQRLTVPLRPAQGVTAARSQVSVRQLNPLTDEQTLQVALSNRRTEAVTVTILERLPAGAKITESSSPAMPSDGDLIEFKVTVPPAGTATLKYVVEVKKG